MYSTGTLPAFWLCLGEGTLGKNCLTDGAQNCSRCFEALSKSLPLLESWGMQFQHHNLCFCSLTFVAKDGYYHQNTSCIAKKCTCSNGTLSGWETLCDFYVATRPYR